MIPGAGGELIHRLRWCPFNLVSLAEEIARVEVSNVILLDASNKESLLVLLVELGGKNLNDNIIKFFWRINAGTNAGFVGLNGSHGGFKRVTMFFHLTLNLPVKLDIVRDIKADGEVKKVANTFITHGAKTLKDDDGCGLDGF